MDVIFDTQNGDSFTIEIGYWDTVLEIKEKVRKYRKIPVSHQTLVFNGKVLEDDGNVDTSVILHNSRVRLVLPSDPEKSKIKCEEQESPVSKKTQLLFKLPSPKIQQQLSMDVDSNDSVEQLKARLHEIEGFWRH